MNTMTATGGSAACSSKDDSRGCCGIEVSVVMPCLDEAETLAECIRKARQGIEEMGVAGEIIVADNGSRDGSPDIASRLGAIVVPVAERGYGSAIRGGVAAARGRYIIIGDADDSYDFSKVAAFWGPLRAGYDLVMGNRFQGGIAPGAMPWLHRWIGNPILSRIGRVFFCSPVSDFHCGLRAFSRSAYERMDLQTSGMEFASEMVVKSSLLGLRVAEVPVTLGRDGRSRPPHLRSWRDGWRHLKFMLLFSPLWLFLVPGILLSSMGVVVAILVLPGTLYVGRVGFDIHTLLAAVFACLIGYQLIVFAVFTKLFAVAEGLHRPSRFLECAQRWLTLERGVLAGGALVLAGTALFAVAFWHWNAADFGRLDPGITMRRLIPALGLLALGVQTVFVSFFLSILGLKKCRQPENAGQAAVPPWRDGPIS